MKLKKNRIFGILFGLALMLGMMPVLGLSQTAYADDYNLWVGGVQVTDVNKDNVLKDDLDNPDNDGKVSFTPAEGSNPAKLTLSGAKITTSDDYGRGIFYEGTDALIIELESGTDNSVISNDSFGNGIVFTNGNITITGKGKLTAEGDSHGIYADSQSVLTIDGSDVTAQGGGYGIYTKNDFTIKSGTLNTSGIGDEGEGICGGGKIIINDGNITAKGSRGAIRTYGTDNVTLGKGVTVKAGDSEASAVDVTDSFAKDYNDKGYKWVQTKEVPKYPLWIGGTQVTSVNYSGPNWFYNADTKTLRLYGSGFGSGEYSNGPTSFDYGIRCEIPDLTINVMTDSTVEGSGTGTYSYGILAAGCKLTIIGDGKLTAKGGSGNTGSGSYGYTTGINADTVNVEGKVEAIGGKSSREDEQSMGVETVEINVTGELTATGNGYGVLCERSGKGGVVIKEGGKVTVTGGKRCVYNGTVKTAINGTAWDDVDGTKGATLIKAGNTGHDLSIFKKAQFPTKADSATVTTKPTAKNLTYNGKAQTLAVAGKASGGTMYYAIGKDNKTAPTTGWSKSIPKGTKAGTYYVWYKAAGDASHIDSAPAFVTATIKAKQKPQPAPTKVSGMLLAKLTAKGKSSLVLTWNKVNGAKGYEVFFARCDGKGTATTKKVKTVKAGKALKWTKTDLKKKTAYKAYVKAYTVKDGKKKYIKTSPLTHAYTSGASKKYSNAKALTVNKTKVTLKKGKTFKIRTKITKVKKSKRLMPKTHVKTVRYMTSNKKVATISAGGKITAKGKGTCTVVAFAHNGVSKKIKVTVK